MGDLEENAATTAAAVRGREGGRESKDKITQSTTQWYIYRGKKATGSSGQ
jgi:hypothetical protein